MKKQQGYITLITTLVFVLIITLTVFISSKGNIINQKTANNAYYSEVAFENAEEGLRTMMSYLSANPSVASAGDYPETPTPMSTETGSYTVQYVYNDGVNPRVVSTGTDASDAQKTITQYVDITGATSPFSNPINAALTTLGDVILGGAASSESVNAGGKVDTFGHGDAGQTTEDSSEFKVALLDNNGNRLTDSDGKVVYRRMTSDEYFMHFFGNLCPVANAANRASDCKAEAKTTVSGLSKGYICDSDCDENMFTTQYGHGKRIFWITENGIKINTAITIGTSADPVFIIIMNNGEVKINGNATINGVVYVDVPLSSEYLVNCSCTATDSALTNTPVLGSHNEPIYSAVDKYTEVSSSTSGSIQCKTSPSCTDYYGNKIKNNKYYIITKQQEITGYKPVIGIVAYDTTNSVWTDPVYSLTANANNVNTCTISACTSAVTKCTPANPVTSSQNQGDTVYSSCSYSGVAISGTDNSPVEIEVLGTWDNTGGGSALVNGAVLTSGHLDNSTGGIRFNRSSTVIDGIPGTNASVTTLTGGWSDLN